MRQKILMISLALLTAAAGLVTHQIITRSQAANPVLYLRADLGTLILLGGALLSAVTGIGLGLWQWARQRVQRQAQTWVAEDRRRFLRRLDHEFKNPLTAIRAGLANLDEVPSADARRETLKSVNTQVVRISRLTADLRKLAELETRPLDFAAVDLSELLPQALAVAQERPEAKERRFTLSLPQAPWPLPAVSGDYDLLFLLIHNLLDNAVKFTFPGDTVELRAFEDGARVVIEVADTGPGIPPEELTHVWEELYRGQGARGVPGSGLGLALVRAIAERHGGRVTLRSRVGQGSVFSLRLPVK